MARLYDQRKRQVELVSRLELVMQLVLERRRSQVRQAVSFLEAINPLQVLRRGYAVVRRAKSTNVVRSAGQVEAGDLLDVILHEGELQTKVVQKKLPEKPGK